MYKWIYQTFEASIISFLLLFIISKENLSYRNKKIWQQKNAKLKDKYLYLKEDGSEI